MELKNEIVKSLEMSEDLPATNGTKKRWLMALESLAKICTQRALNCSPNGKSENDKYFYYLLVYIKKKLGFISLFLLFY